MKYKFVMFLVGASLALLACSHDINNAEIDNSKNASDFYSCLNEFKINFSDETEKLKSLKTRSMEISDNEEYDLFVDSIGNEIIADLLPSSVKLEHEIGLTEEDFKEIEKEYGFPSDFMKVYFALGIMEEMNISETRAGVEDVASCVITGYGYKEFVGGGAKLALRKFATKAAKKIVPYIGWGWWVTETVACLARL